MVILNISKGATVVEILDYLQLDKDEFLENESYKSLTNLIFFPF